jgi:hypothetical protein
MNTTTPIRATGRRRVGLRIAGMVAALAVVGGTSVIAIRIRSIVLPCTLSLLGQQSWYVPRWLRWLPRIEVESPHVAPRTGDTQPSLVSAAL